MPCDPLRPNHPPRRTLRRGAGVDNGRNVNCNVCIVFKQEIANALTTKTTDYVKIIVCTRIYREKGVKVYLDDG